MLLICLIVSIVYNCKSTRICTKMRRKYFLYKHLINDVEVHESNGNMQEKKANVGSMHMQEKKADVGNMQGNKAQEVEESMFIKMY